VNYQGPSKAGCIAGVVLCSLAIIGAVIFAAWSRSVFSIIFAAAATVLLPISILRSRKLGEEKMMRRQDRAMQTRDDPNEMARWVP
jgi:hypothetical protein